RRSARASPCPRCTPPPSGVTAPQCREQQAPFRYSNARLPDALGLGTPPNDVRPRGGLVRFVLTCLPVVVSSRWRRVFLRCEPPEARVGAVRIFRAGLTL